MNNIILQHFTGDLRPLDLLSIENMFQYSRRIDVGYIFLEGQKFRKHLTPPCQKVYMLDEEWDGYDNVLMLDIDMFTTKDLTENVFEVEPGIGLINSTSDRLVSELNSRGRLPLGAVYWSGAFRKMSREVRQKLRAQIPSDDRWMDMYNAPYRYEDEGIMAELYNKSGLRMDTCIDERWNQNSFSLLNKPGFIHIRTKVAPEGPKRLKMENYEQLKNDGII